MNLEAMRTYFRMLVDDRHSDSWDDPEVDNFLNRAQERIQREINDVDEGFFTDCQTYSVASDPDGFEFALPATFLKVAHAERLVDGGVPIPAHWVHFAQRHTAGARQHDCPNLYLRGSSTLGVVAPSDSYTLVLWYLKRLPDLVNLTDESEVPLEHHEYLCLKAAKTCMLADGQDFTKWEKEYNEQQAALALFLESRQRQKARRVHYVPE